MPLHFEANQGQWNPEVRYAARSGAGTVFLTERGPALATSTHRIDLNLLHSNRAPQLEGLDRLAMRTNYFVGDRAHWHTGVAQFGRVAYRAVYPGIDVVYYGDRNQLEYDFVLRPGADPSVIRLQFRGAEHVSLTPEGDLLVESGDARFVQKRPVIYQEDPRTAVRHAVEGRYALLGRGIAGVRVGAYDPTKPLVVDPVLVYGTFIGGAMSEGITAVASDPHGLIYAVGYTYGTDLVVTSLAPQTKNNGGLDVIALIMDPTKSGANSLLYLSYLGGSRDESPTAVTIDPAGLMYMTGTTTSSDFPIAGDPVQNTYKIGATATVFLPEVFVAVINPTTTLVYGSYFGGTGGDTPYGIVLDPQGNIYVGGTTSSTDFPATASAFQTTLSGPSDAFLVKIDPLTNVVPYATYVGGEGRDDCRGIAISSTGLIYFAASTLSQAFPLAGNPYQNSLLGFESLVIGVIDPNQLGVSSLVYSTYFGGSTLDEVRGIALDAKGRLLLTGWTLSSDFPTTSNALQPTAPGMAVAFAARVNPLGTPAQFLDYSTFLGGSGGDVAYNIATDSAGLIYVAGYTLSSDFPVTPDAVQSQFGAGIDVFLVKLDPSVAGMGGLLYGSYFGTTGVHVPGGLTIAPNGSIYLVGYTTDSMQTTGSALQASFGGGYTDGFVLVLK